MKLYLLSLGAGLLVGAICSFLNIRSPAPPVVALIGLLGILISEQSVPLARQILSGEPIDLGWFHRHCMPHMFGHLPGCTQVETVRVKDADSPGPKAG
ncbi:XapX domain-containing protein [Shinella kummerowiae]|uniref:XapX domain-containing protein n=1 Tax=Shinella kummerowiae TaxID=417745 RepID=UPI0021B52256|nr:XapX domain-containing protein [Shinella kummerowiae]MCT7663855.1 XapX domain-containing protein [Shinella kummerowiae]